MTRKRRTIVVALMVLAGIAFILGLICAVGAPRHYTNPCVSQSGEWLKQPQPHELESAAMYIGMELRSYHHILRALNWTSCLQAVSALLFMMAAIIALTGATKANNALNPTSGDPAEGEG